MSLLIKGNDKYHYGLQEWTYDPTIDGQRACYILKAKPKSINDWEEIIEDLITYNYLAKDRSSYYDDDAYTYIANYVNYMCFFAVKGKGMIAKEDLPKFDMKKIIDKARIAAVTKVVTEIKDVILN